MKTKLATFAVFQIHPSGADELYKSRDLTGQPLMSWGAAVTMKEHLLNNCTNQNNLNLIVRKLK